MKTFFFFWRALALVSLVLGLGLEHSCPLPRECLSSERLSLALASDFFCVLGPGHGLEPCVLDSTSGSDSQTGQGIAQPAWKFFLSCMHSGVGLGKIFQRGVHESKLKTGIMSLGSGSKSPAAGGDKGVWGRNPSAQKILRCFTKITQS